jgi:hypothetical protein
VGTTPIVFESLSENTDFSFGRRVKVESAGKRVMRVVAAADPALFTSVTSFINMFVSLAG